MRSVEYIARLSVVLGVLLCYTMVYADTHWVNLNGSNTPPYTSYATGAHEIQDGIDVAVAGDTVRIAAGLYQPDTTIALRDSIAIIGSGQDSTKIFSDESHFHSVIGISGPSGGAGGGIIIEHCAIRGYDKQNAPCQDGINIHLKNSTTNYIRHNSFYYCQQALNLGYSDMIVSDNFFDSNQTAIWISFGGPFDIHNNSIIGWPLGGGNPSAKGISNFMVLLGPAKIHHNTIFTHRGTGIGMQNLGDSLQIYNNLIVSGGSQIFSVYCDCDGAIVRNNVLIRTAIDPKWPLARFSVEPGSEIVIENNVFQGKDGQVRVAHGYETGGSWRFAFNDIWGLDGSGLDCEEPCNTLDTVGNLYRNPMFTNDSLHYLQRGSPLIDKGNPAIQDVDGSRSDIGWTGGPNGITYEYLEQSPQRPDTLVGELNSDTVFLSWAPNSEADLAGYRLYRDIFAGFDPVVENLLVAVTPEDTSYPDTVAGTPGDLYYLLTAFDSAGLESHPSNEIAIQRTGILGEMEVSDTIQHSPYIIVNYPNPFNSSTNIVFSGSGLVSGVGLPQISVYDILGRKLIDLTLTYRGDNRWSTSWKGMTASGRVVNSGIYFVRASYQGIETTRKICLIR